MPAPQRPIYVLRIRGLPRTDEVRALRSLLKRMLREFRFQCLSIEPETRKDETHGEDIEASFTGTGEAGGAGSSRPGWQYRQPETMAGMTLRKMPTRA